MDDATLKALLSDDGLPERDPTFTYAVMRRVAARRAAFDIAGLIAPALALAAVLWALVPLAEPLLAKARLTDLSPVMIAAVVTLSLLWPLGLLRAPARMTET